MAYLKGLGPLYEETMFSRTRKILVVEPNLEVSTRLLKWLSRGLDLSTSQFFHQPHAYGALRVYQDEHPDILLVNAHLGEDDILRPLREHLTGRELCQRIRLLDGKRHTGVIFFTEAPADDDKLSVDCLENGADDFLRETCSPEEFIARVKAVLRLKAMTDELRSANHKLGMLSMTDELTGLANMRCFAMKLTQTMRAVRSQTTGLGIIMLDLDRFKNVNDTFNHLMGSHCIKEVGNLVGLPDLSTKESFAARYGGDEFIIFMHADSVDEVSARAERIRSLVRISEFARDGASVRLTSSCGAAFADPGYAGTPEDLIKYADMMLYRSKELGRDRVTSIKIGDKLSAQDQRLLKSERFFNRLVDHGDDASVELENDGTLPKAS